MSKLLKKRLEDLLLESGLLKPKDFNRALKIQKTTNKKLEEILVDEGILDQRQIVEALGSQLGIPHVSLEDYYIDLETARMVPESMAKKHLFIPIKKDKNIITVAMADPLNVYVIDNIRIATGLKVERVIATAQDIKEALSKVFDVKGLVDKATKDYSKDLIADCKLEQIDIPGPDDAPIIKLVSTLIFQSFKEGASDIHIEPMENLMRVRYRVDGNLREVLTTAKSIHPPLTTRIKIMSDLNIAEKRLPQDGRIKMTIENKEVDMRVSTLPTIHGEKIAIRLLDKTTFLFNKKELGFSKKDIQKFESLLKLPNGMVLVTGPTGSGKTTTLYTALSELNQMDKNIVTIEDPVEYILQGINQIQVNNKSGLSFSTGLRSILRQDPNIIMVGEIRDFETAHIAVRAAITGHLVFSTLHTNDAPSTVIRLIDMGIEPYMVASSISGIISQRLVKTICRHCKELLDRTDVQYIMLENLGYNFDLYYGKGCKYCNGIGYKGRIAIHEIMVVSKTIREHILKGASKDTIKDIALMEGMDTLRDNGIKLIQQGRTTLREVLRVTYDIDSG